jgi:hypothetical protein
VKPWLHSLLDFTLITCMANTVMGSVWYLDSGASFHMTGCRDFFSDLEEKYLQMHIEIGDDGRYNMTRIGTVTFQRESGSPLRLKDVMFVPGLKKNLISVAVLEDHGYDVIFSKGKAFLRHIATGQVKQIGVHVKNLYKLDVEDCVALSTKAEKVQSHAMSVNFGTEDLAICIMAPLKYYATNNHWPP